MADKISCGFAECPECGEIIECDCRGCIESETLVCNKCKKEDGSPKIFDNVKWKVNSAMQGEDQ